jgi:hypothetical protein
MSQSYPNLLWDSIAGVHRLSVLERMSALFVTWLIRQAVKRHTVELHTRTRQSRFFESQCHVIAETGYVQQGLHKQSSQPRLVWTCPIYRMQLTLAQSRQLLQRVLAPSMPEVGTQTLSDPEERLQLRWLIGLDVDYCCCHLPANDLSFSQNQSFLDPLWRRVDEVDESSRHRVLNLRSCQLSEGYRLQGVAIYLWRSPWRSFQSLHFATSQEPQTCSCSRSAILPSYQIPLRICMKIPPEMTVLHCGPRSPVDILSCLFRRILLFSAAVSKTGTFLTV